MHKKMKVENIYLFLIGIWALVMAVMIPTWQTPDEFTHLKLIGTSIHNEKFAENLLDDYNFSSHNEVLKQNETWSLDDQKKVMVQPPSYTRMEMMPQGVSLSVITHLPATVAMMIGILIGLPTYWVLLLGEIASLFFYLIICYYALKIIPIKRDVFAVCIFLPMALQQAGSLGYDAVVLPLCFLFIAYMLSIKFNRQKVTLKKMALVIFLWLIISYIKLPYTFLILLILMIPLKQFEIRLGRVIIEEKLIRRLRVPFCIVVAVVLVGGVYIFRSNRWIQIVYGSFTEWPRTVYLFQQTVLVWGKDLVTGIIGNFGWLDVTVGFVCAVLMYVFVLFVSMFGNENEQRIKAWDRLVIFITAAAIILFTFLSMINHTIMVTLYGSEALDRTYNIHEALYQIPYIGGLQGRYFLPAVPLVFMLVPQIKCIDKKKSCIIIAVVEVILAFYVLSLLAGRYWGL